MNINACRKHKQVYSEGGYCTGCQNEKATSDSLEKLFLEAIEEVRKWYPTDIFLEDGKSQDCLSAKMARKTCDNIKAKYQELKEGLNEYREQAY